MKEFEKEMEAYKAYLIQERFETPKEEKILQTIEKSKESFYMLESQRHTSRLEFLFQQAGYIQKRWWIFQFLVLAGMWWILATTHSSLYIRRGMGMAAPLFVILIVPELWKNRASASMEIEGASYYSLRQIYAARMLAFAMADILLLSLFFLAAAFTVQLSVGEVIVQFFLPFNVACCICFYTLCIRGIRSEIFSVVLCMCWTILWIQVILKEEIYAAVSVPAWAGAVSLSVLCVILSMRSVWKNCENYWEVNALWN